jgi:ABC-type branched-subunit amino acid transport system substrate-binding protein
MGLIAGVAVTGLAVPYVRSERVTTQASADGLAAAGTSDPAAGAATASDPAAVGASPGSTVPGAAGSPSGTPEAGGGAPASAGPAAGGATDIGVTANQIKLGIGIVDVGAAKDLGFNFDIGDEHARYEALIAAQNAKGGINGRKIVADYRTFDATNPAAPAQAACVAWTKDVKVFSVLVESQFPIAAAVCVYGQGQTPFITTDGVDASYYSSGLYFSTQASDTRILIDHARYLHSKGLLKGKTIGVVSGDGAERTGIDRALVPELQRLGYQVADVEIVPTSVAGTQRIPIVISNLKAKKVDYVILAANVILAGPFVQAADRAGYHPGFGLSDINNEINDQVASYYPDSFEGTVGISTHRFAEYRAGAPLAPADQACIDRVRKVDPKVLPTTNSAFEVAMGECAMFDSWVAGALGAGPALTRASWLAAMERSTAPFGIPSTLDGTFGPGKHDAVDFEREVVWHKSCKCWELVGGRSTPIRRMDA